MNSAYCYLYKLFNEKARKFKSYQSTAKRFEFDDFNVIVCSGHWYIDRQGYSLPISNKTYKHIEQALNELGCKRLYKEV